MQKPNHVELKIDNLFELMNVFVKKAVETKCFSNEEEDKIEKSMLFLNGKDTTFFSNPEEALNIIIKSFNIAQEKGRYNLMDAFNIVQIIMFIQNNLEKVKKQMNKTQEQDFDLTELTEPIPLKGRVVSL